MHYDPTNNISWQLGYRGRVAVFIDGNNLFHAARFHNIDIDYNKLLRVLLGDGRLLRAFFYTGVDVGAERQQGFLLWMRRNGFRVIHKELKTFYDGTRKANLDVEIAVDMLSLAGRYDTAVLVSGDEDFVYAVNAVAYKGCRVEVAGFRSNTAPKLIDVADYFIDLGEIADKGGKVILVSYSDLTTQYRDRNMDVFFANLAVPGAAIQEASLARSSEMTAPMSRRPAILTIGAS